MQGGTTTHANRARRPRHQSRIGSWGKTQSQTKQMAADAYWIIVCRRLFQHYSDGNASIAKVFRTVFLCSFPVGWTFYELWLWWFTTASVGIAPIRTLVISNERRNITPMQSKRKESKLVRGNQFGMICFFQNASKKHQNPGGTNPY